MMSALTFLLAKVYPILSVMLEMYVCMWIFSGLSAIGILFISFGVHETKGLSIHK